MKEVASSGGLPAQERSEEGDALGYGVCLRLSGVGVVLLYGWASDAMGWAYEMDVALHALVVLGWDVLGEKVERVRCALVKMECLEQADVLGACKKMRSRCSAL